MPTGTTTTCTVLVMRFSSTVIVTSPRPPALNRPGPSIGKMAKLLLRQRASLVTSREDPSVRIALAVNVAVSPGASVRGPLISIRATAAVNGVGAGSGRRFLVAGREDRQHP